ncbi:hypothetical protein EJ02DRAFT_514009 [Clathrospora elynae]|uniref:Uncharacterized protein n=1 Tax=Clathrospora elynae TaxID=706981 RepID=A0A6A5SGE1_9PLEO|nr:hypothetical protein EJ02DRAFT_514009 [Clathrospora elynae]
MACSYGVNDIPEFQAIKTQAAVEQPRPATNQLSRAALPHAEPCPQSQSFFLEKLPLNCRLLVWDHILQAPYTRIERWRPPYYGSSITAYSEALEVIYSSTTFVFATPMDIHCFQVTALLEGLASVKALIISFGRIDWPNNGPFHQEEGLKEWEHVFHGIDKMPSLRELQVWYYHGDFGKPKELVWARRPWEERMGSEAVEQRHRKLFDLFATVDLPKFTINLMWKPEDLLAQREWPFRIDPQTNDEIYRGMMKFPYPLEPDMYS